MSTINHNILINWVATGVAASLTYEVYSVDQILRVTGTDAGECGTRGVYAKQIAWDIASWGLPLRSIWTDGVDVALGDEDLLSDVVQVNGVGVTPLNSLIVNQVSTGGNLFTSNLINEVMEIPQGMAWSNDELTPITVLETGRNWPDLGDYPAGTGGLGVYLELAIRPQYTNLASYPGTPAASLVIPCTVTGSPGSQVITIRPDSNTANLMPTNAATNGPNGFPYTAQIWASAGPSDEVLLFRGFATIVEDARS